MSRTLIVSHIDSKVGCRLAYHHINVPTPGEKGFYRQIGSINAFFHGMNQYNNTGEIIFHATDEISVKSHKEIDKIEHPVIQHTSIYEFYTFIGWDRHTKKWINGKPNLP